MRKAPRLTFNSDNFPSTNFISGLLSLFFLLGCKCCSLWFPHRQHTDIHHHWYPSSYKSSIKKDWSNYRIPVHKDTWLTETGPRSRSQIAKTLRKRSPVVRYCIVMRTLMDCHRGPQSHSEILYNNEYITETATAVRSPVVRYCMVIRTLHGLPPRSAVP